MVTRRSLAASIAGLTMLAGFGGCGTHTRSAAPPSQKVADAFKGSPAPLAALHAQANRLLGGGPTAFQALLRRLHGYPVVVNKWASWCGPCKIEFPAFQQASVSFGRKVAFVGVDGKDADPAAAAFLRSFPVSYPSYTDPQESIASSIHASTYYPQTVYYSPQGKILFDHAGPYATATALERDIRFYLLGHT